MNAAFGNFSANSPTDSSDVPPVPPPPRSAPAAGVDPAEGCAVLLRLDVARAGGTFWCAVKFLRRCAGGLRVVRLPGRATLRVASLRLLDALQPLGPRPACLARWPFSPLTPCLVPPAAVCVGTVKRCGRSADTRARGPSSWGPAHQRGFP